MNKKQYTLNTCIHIWELTFPYVSVLLHWEHCTLSAPWSTQQIFFSAYKKSSDAQSVRFFTNVTGFDLLPLVKFTMQISLAVEYKSTVLSFTFEPKK